jgi:ABC-type polysaccharide/polyol phosphate export permease
VGAVRAATSSLISHRNLVTKIYFPRTILPVSAVLSQMVDFLVASVVVFVALALAGLGVGLTIMMAPIVLLILVMLVLGISLIVSAASLFLRDVKYIVEVVLTFAIFFTPVFYDVDMFPEYANLLLLNPVAPLLEALRSTVVLHSWPDWGWLMYSLVWSVLLVSAGLRLFKRLEPAFAESI